MTDRPVSDTANGYEEHAAAFLDARDRSSVGAAVVERWARGLAPGSAVLELGCGGGYPVTRILRDAGLDVRAVDASPTLAHVFGERFPDVPVACEPVEESRYFDREFDAAIAIGLVFLLPAASQPAVVARVASALRPGGRFLFTAPVEAGTWRDVVTGRESCSLGREGYEQALAAAGLSVVGTVDDEGGNNHYDTVRAEDEASV